jgi:hypothetical protein
MMVSMVLLAGCLQPAPPPVRLSERFVSSLCGAPQVVVGEITSVDSFEDETHPQLFWSHGAFRVDERLRGAGQDRLHLVMSGAEIPLAQAHPGSGMPLQPAVGLRYVLAYHDIEEGGRFLNPGDPGVDGLLPIAGAPRQQDATLQAIRAEVARCRTSTRSSPRGTEGLW